MIDFGRISQSRYGYRPDQVQDFIPAPFDVATAMYHTGLDPFSKQPVYVVATRAIASRGGALMQFFAGKLASRCATRWNKPDGRI